MEFIIINNQLIKFTMRPCSFNLVTIVCGLFFCSGAFAVGFGEPLLRSYLGQPLNVQVPVSGVSQSDLNADCIQATVNTIEGDFIASPRIEFIEPKRTSAPSDASTLIHLTTTEKVIEPAIALSVAVKCGPSMQRTFSLLLDYAEIYSPAMAASATDHAEPATLIPLAENFVEPAVTKRTVSKSAEGTRRTRAAKKSPPVVQPGSSISKKLPSIAPSAKDQLKISNEVISKNTSVGTPFLAGTKPADIEQQRIQENTLARERFADMLRDEPALLATQAADTENVAGNTAQNSAQNAAQLAAQKTQLEAQQKVQRLEVELKQLKLHIQNNNLAERPYPMHLLVINAVVLLLLLVLLFVVGKLYFSLRKVRQHQNGSWWNSQAEKADDNVNKLPALAKEEKPGPASVSAPQKSNPVKEIWHNKLQPDPKQPDFDLNPEADPANPLSASDEANGSLFNLVTQRQQSIQIEELSDSTQEAEFWASINNPRRAIEILEPQSLDASLSMPVTLLYLLDLYRLVDDEDKYTKLSARLKRQFNMHLPEFSEAVNPAKLKSLEDYEHVISRCCAFWNTNYILPYLESLLIDDREGQRTGFDLSVYRDILFLISICKELDRTKTISVSLTD